MTEITQQPVVYENFHEIQERKMQLKKEIQKDSMRMEKLKNQLFNKSSVPQRSGLHMNMSDIVKTGTGMFDGLLLIWKLYRKFKR